jgi:5-methylcytosine-specific restriction protein A
LFFESVIYNRRDIHKLHGGQQQGGISTPSKKKIIMLFSGEQGKRYGYQDHWIEEGVYLFSGEGQYGDMSFVRGNLAVRNHIEDGKDLHLFEYVRTGFVRYIGQMVFIGYREGKGLDREGALRKVLIFELIRINAINEMVETDEDSFVKEMWKESLQALRKKALSVSSYGNTVSERRINVFDRARAISTYVSRRANGYCEACKSKAPFKNIFGRPFLEVHHIRRLSDGGPDHPFWVIGVCPNCHRRAHYGQDREDFNQSLISIVEKREKEMTQ